MPRSARGGSGNCYPRRGEKQGKRCAGWPTLGTTASRPGRALTVGEIGTLSDLDNIAVRIADVAANLAVLGYRRRDELGSSAFPKLITCLNISNPEIHKAV